MKCLALKGRVHRCNLPINVAGIGPANYLSLRFCGKLVATLLILFCFQVHAQALGQGNITITLSVKDAPAEQVFRELKKQSGYGFVYPSEVLNRLNRITLSVNKASLEDVLNQVFKGQPYTYSIIDKIVVIKFREVATAQPPGKDLSVPLPIDVTGKVTNEKGEPLPGVTVTVKGTDKITTTDAGGGFTINSVDREAVLLFSSVNMEPFELRVSGKSDLAIRMKAKVRELDDVTVMVNTGYEKVPKERATGSFEFVNSEKINRRAGTDILSRLEGLVPGIYFDKRNLQSSQNIIPLNNITIRGLSTLTENMKRPLVVVNNFPYEQDVTNINPNDIESITLLKDAAAASIWGARAANGVIVITTKQGQFNQATRLSFNSNVTIGERPDLYKYPRMSIQDFIDNEIFLFHNGFYNADLNNPVTGSALSPVVEMLAQRQAGIISAKDSASMIAALSSKDVRSDFDKYIYQKSTASQYSLSLSGGSNTVKYIIGLGYDKNQYNLTGNEYERINARADLTIRPIKNLDLTISTAYTNAKNKSNSLGDFGATTYEFKSGVALYPYAQLADDNGNPLITPKYYRTGYTDTAGGGKLLDWQYRPLDEMKNIDNENESNNLLFNFSAQYKLTNYLSITASYQYELTNGEVKNLMNEQSFFTRNLINLYTEISPLGVKNNMPVGGILDQNNYKMQAHAERLQANFSKNWNSEHQIVSILGVETREKKQDQNTYRTYGYNNNLSAALVDYINRFPLYGGRGSSTIPFLNSISKKVDRFVSVFGNASYTYLNKYILSASARKDAANIFGVNTNNKWKPFWTVGLAWNVSNEKFMDIKALNFLKLRGSIGYQGNVNNSISPYAIINYSPASSSPINQPYSSISTPGNPGLSWEKVRQLNIGLDFGFFHSRISGSIDVYKKATNNLILREEVDPTTGISSIFKNSGSMLGKGIDASLSSINISTKTFKWTTELGISYTTTKVKDYKIDNDGLLIGNWLNGGGASGLNINPLKGKPPYSIFSYQFGGLDPQTGDPIGYLGKTTSTDYYQISQQLLDSSNVVYHGSSIPTYFGYFNNIITYKGFSLTVNINYKLGYYFRKSSLSYYRLYNAGVSHADYAKRWQQPGDEANTTVPSKIYPAGNNFRDDFYAYSTANVLKGDHIRLQFIRFGYEFNNDLLRKISVRNVEVYLMANNLGVIWRANKESLDPDYDPSVSLFPPPKNIVAGVKIDL